jgi:glycosyltransferase involved in cell wall biosynthesis
MKISVCIPTFNSEATSVRVSKVSCPGRRRVRLIIFDNASEDGSWEIIQSFSNPRVRVLRSAQNRGVSRNFNRALHAASGDTTAG